jgi:hypothetical protein
MKPGKEKYSKNAYLIRVFTNIRVFTRTMFMKNRSEWGSAPKSLNENISKRWNDRCAVRRRQRSPEVGETRIHGGTNWYA